MLVFRLFQSLKDKITIILRMLPQGLSGRWKLSMFFSLLLPVADLILAYWLYILLMMLQGGQITIGHFALGREHLVAAVVILLAISIIRQAVDLLSLTYSGRLIQAIYRRFSEQLVKKYLSLPWLSFAGDNRSARIKHSTITALDASYSYQVVLNLISSSFTILLLGAGTFVKMPVLASGLLVTVAILLYLNRTFIAKKVGIKAALHEVHQKEYHQKLHELFDLPREINLFQVNEYFLNSINTQLKKLSRLKADLSILPQIPRVSVDLVLTTAIAVALIVASSSGLQGSKELIANFAAVVVLARRILPSVSQLLAAYSDLYGSMMNVEIIRADLNHVPDAVPVVEKRHFNEAALYIRLQDISFHYPRGDTILDHISLDICANDRIAVFGRTGKGKSTLMMIAAGIIKPSTGRVFIEDHLFLKKPVIAYVAQDIKLLNGTVLDNIIFGSKLVDEARAWKMLELVCLDGHIKQIPEGIYSDIGDNGVKFSGGQRQRLGIARALYFNPKVLFLDEATSAIDEQTEYLIMENINKFMEDGAVVFITHRRSNADRFANKFCHL